MLQSILATILAYASLTSAVPLERRQVQQANTSAPFNLIVETAHNETLNGSQLFSYHAGAGIEQLGIVKQTLDTVNTAGLFQFNSSSYSSYETDTGSYGTLVWTLHGNNFNVSQALGFNYSPFYNTAVPEFGIGSTIFLKFADDFLLVPHTTSTTTSAIDSWYACDIPQDQALGYNYFALAWGLGTAVPDNKSCQKVSVKRLFI